MNHTLRQRMVEEQIKARGITQPDVLQAMENIPRHLFVPADCQSRAYEDTPLPIGYNQTISQPYIVALMTSLIDWTVTRKVLEIGTGSGYQTAILSQLAEEVYTIEVITELGTRAKRIFSLLGYKNIHLLIDDGFNGWPAHAPFDAIIITAAPREIPEALLEQLENGGTMVVPVGAYEQDLFVIRKTPDGLETQNAGPVRFVPMVRKEGMGE